MSEPISLEVPGHALEDFDSDVEETTTVGGFNDAPVIHPVVPVQPARGAAFALSLLFCVNLFNYIDRYIPSALKDKVKAGLHLQRNVATGLPLTVLLVVYMIASPIFGHLSDKGYDRRKLLACGVVLWSFAATATAFTWNFTSFLVFRALVGVGEACYSTIAPALLSGIS